MSNISRRHLGAILGTAALPIPALAAPTRAVLFKDPSCCCCEGHADCLRQEGFAVEVRPVDYLEQMSLRAGVPPRTARVSLDPGQRLSGRGARQRFHDLQAAARAPGNRGDHNAGHADRHLGMPGPRSGPLQVFAISKTGGAPSV